MKLSLPNIKIGPAGIGFILCLLAIVTLGVFLSVTADSTLEYRQSKTPMAAVNLNSDINELEDELAEATDPIEKDLPPSVEDISDTVEVTPVETRTPLFTDEELDVKPIEVVEKFEDDVSEEIAEEIDIDKASETPPRIAIIISDMGLSASATEAAINTLPKGVTLAFAPYANDLKKWVDKARRSGRDFLISIPMEPETFPNDDPGPNALLMSLPDEENIARLEWALSQATGYVGIVNFMGSRFTASQEKLSPIMMALKDKDIMVLDSGSGSNSLIPSMARVNNIAYAKNDRFIDNKATAKAIDEQLNALENIALTRGQAIGIGFPYPITFERILEWSNELTDKGIILVPISDFSNGND